MRELPEGMSIVSDVEFQTLSCLPEFEERGADCLRRQDGEKYFFIMRQSEWVRHERIAAKVEAECQTLDAAAPFQESPEFEELLARENKPAPEPRNQSHAGSCHSVGI